MDLIQDLFRTLYNVPELIRIGGLLGLVVVIFAETGLMVGFFLPGDSLLVTAGLFAAKGDLDILWLNLALIAAAVVGDAVGYWIGWKAGKALYSRPNSFFFRREHLIKTHEFYEKHGGKTIIIARFMPIVRTFAPTVAGAADMTYRRFAVYNVVGGIGWVLSMTLTGYFLGQMFGPALERNIHVLVAVVIFLSLLPAIIAWLRERMKAKASRPASSQPAGPAVPPSPVARVVEPTE